MRMTLGRRCDESTGEQRQHGFGMAGAIAFKVTQALLNAIHILRNTTMQLFSLIGLVNA